MRPCMFPEEGGNRLPEVENRRTSDPGVLYVVLMSKSRGRLNSLAVQVE